MKRHVSALLAMLLCSLVGQAAGAQSNLLWTNSAQGGGPAHIQAFDKSTGALVRSFAGANGNGRGIVVVMTATMRPVSLRTGAVTTEMPRSNDDWLVA